MLNSFVLYLCVFVFVTNVIFCLSKWLCTEYSGYQKEAVPYTYLQ